MSFAATSSITVVSTTSVDESLPQATSEMLATRASASTFFIKGISLI
jgi:hypothetical protein